MAPDYFALSHDAAERAGRFEDNNDFQYACEAYLDAADKMLLYSREVVGENRYNAQQIARRLIEKAQAAKQRAAEKERPVSPVTYPARETAPRPPVKDNPAPGNTPGGNKEAIAKDLESYRKLSGSKGASRAEDRMKFVPVESPGVYFSDIAGLEGVKELVRLKVIQPILHPELYERFDKAKNGGILLYGPPGTGKTMIARAIATETGLAFYSVRCSDIVGKKFGDGERNLQALFDAARETGRAMIFFDEFEAIACKRGGGSTIMNRIVPELLSQMDGFQQAEGQLIVLASTNRPWDLDTAVLRPPRMTERIYVGLPDFAARHYLVKHALEPLPKSEMPDYDAIAEALDGFNCADIMAFIEKIKEAPIKRGLLSGTEEQYICNDDIQNALDGARSSVQPGDLEAIVKWEATQN